MSEGRRGRPRSRRVDRAIRSAVLELLAERGYGGATIDAVSARAGVTRPTIYRRYASKAELVAAAVEGELDVANPDVPDRGNAVDDVRILLANTIKMIRGPMGGVVRAIVPELERDEDLRRASQRMLERRRRLLRTAIHRGVERGEFAGDLNVEVAIDALLGGVYLRLLITGQPLTPRLAGELVRLIAAD